MTAEKRMDRPMLDPRAVFALVIYLSSAAVIFRQAWQLLPVTVVALAAAGLMRVKFYQLFYKLRRLWYMIVVVAFLQGIFNPSGTVYFQLGAVTLLTSGGILTGLAVLERMAILIIGGSMLSRYASRVLVQAMIQMKIPCELAYMVSIGIRFIPLMSQSLKDSITAIQLRGVDFDKLSFKKRMKVYAYLLLPTIATGINNAHQLSIAMELRGFRAYDRRTSFFVLRFTPGDYLFLAGVGVISIATVLAAVML